MTGVRGAPRSVMDSPTPIDVFSNEELNRQSPAGLFESLRYLVPSFNLPQRAGGGSATVIASGGLRGLNPDQTLVLVNGKRRHETSLINSVSALYNGSAGVDLNMIPTASIDRIEVLRDGAASQYGSDAIAGVINIILKDDPQAGSASLSTGQNFDRGDGEFLRASVDQGFALGSDGFAHLSLEYIDRKASNRAVEISPDFDLYPRLPDGSRDPREETIDRMVTTNYGNFPQTTWVAGLNSGYNLGNGVELYGFATYAERESDLNWSYREPRLSPDALPEVYPDGFRPLTIFDETDYEVAIGTRFTAFEYDFDLSTNFGHNKADWTNTNSLNSSLGPESPTTFDVGALEASEWTVSLDGTRSFMLEQGTLQASFGVQHRWEKYKISEGEPASYAAGTYVRPPGQLFAGQPLTPGSQATPGFRPEDAGSRTRRNNNVYGELGWEPTSRLFLGAGLRYEDFNDASGDTLIYKLTGRYEVTPDIAVRGSMNTGFRAPTLAQVAYASTTSQFRDLTGDGEQELLLLKTLPSDSPEAVALGATPLVPEESFNVSLGLTASLTDNLTMTLDGYQIDVDDRIVITSAFSPLDTRLSADGVTTIGEQIQSILVANGLSPDISGQFYTNAIDTRTRGVDLVLSWRHSADWGNLRVNAGYNYNDTKIRSIVDNPEELSSLGDIELFNRNRQGNLTDSIPDSKASVSINFQRQAFGANLRATRFGGYTVLNATNPDLDQDSSAKIITDLELSYQVTEAITLSAGGNNIFNVYPTEVQEPNARRGAGQYQTFAPFGFTGGSWYLRAIAQW